MIRRESLVASRALVGPALALLAFGALALLATATIHTTRPGGFLPGFRWWFISSWCVYPLAALLATRLRDRRVAFVLVVGGAALLQLLMLTRSPALSDDLYRYIWDGRVQAAGVDPYRYAPSSPHLASLRDSFLFPSTAHRPYWGCHSLPAPSAVCTRINRPTVPTIYPPVAEAYFWLVHVLSPAGSGTLPLQLADAALAVATTLTLWAVLRRAGRAPASAAWFGWCPMIGFEAGGNAHVDFLELPLLVLGLALLAGVMVPRGRLGGAVGRGAVAGVLLGLATCVKLLPGLVMPAAIRRSWREAVAVALGAAAGFALPYVPHVAAVGAGVLGYLPGYATENGYDTSGHTGFLVVDLVRRTVFAGLLPASADNALAVTVVALTAALVFRYAPPNRPWRGATLLTGVTLLVIDTDYSWYGVLLVALVALDGRLEWLAVAAAPYVADLWQASGWPVHDGLVVGYTAASFVVIAVSLARARRAISVHVRATHESRRRAAAVADPAPAAQPARR